MLDSVETLLTIAHAPDAQLHKRRLADITRTMIQISLHLPPLSYTINVAVALNTNKEGNHITQ